MGGMAPPPRPSRLSTPSVVPPPPPGLPPSVSGGGGAVSSSRGSAFDESLTLAPLQIPNSPSQVSERSLSSSGPISGLGIMTAGAGGPVAYQQRGGSADTQARGIEAMVMSIPYLNKLDVLRKISPPLGPPGPGSPIVEMRGPVIAVEGANSALMKAVRPIIERALRSSGECEVRLWMDSSVDDELSGLSTPPISREGGTGVGNIVRRSSGSDAEDVEMAEGSQQQQQEKGSGSGSRQNSVGATSSGGGSGRGGSSTPVPPPVRRGTTATTTGEYGGGSGSNTNHTPTGMYHYLQTIMSWHVRSAEIIKHITTQPSMYSPTSTISPEAEAKRTLRNSSHPTIRSSSRLLPVALIPGGFSLSLSDRFASTVAITDPYSPVDHWQWMATLWRGIVGADLVVYVRGMTPDELARNSGTVEYRAPGVMVVRVAMTAGGGGGSGSGDNNVKIDEKTERRLAFEVMEWVRAGSFRDGYAFGSHGSFGGAEGN